VFENNTAGEKLHYYRDFVSLSVTVLRMLLLNGLFIRFKCI
jgi:hypothetical protein